jgi:hypothetical protein
MGIDIGALTEGLGFLSGVITVLERLRALLPDGSEKNTVVEALKQAEQAEQKFKLAQAQVAQELGYEICRNHVPPGIMVSRDDVHWKCPECGNERELDDPNIPAIAIVPPPRRW